jgi:hypothetical protein
VPQGDITPPVIQSLTASPNRLWPPNGKPVPVQVAVTGDGVASASLAIGDEYHEFDGLVDMTSNGGGRFTYVLSLPAQRMGNDLDGRTVTLNVSVTDNAGNTSQASIVVLVPHDQRKR